MSHGSTALGVWLPFQAILFCLGTGLSVFLIRLLHPWLVRYAMAKPTARGLHTIPTPQGGGIAVLCSTMAVGAAGAWWVGVAEGDWARLAAVAAATTGLAMLGLMDDIRPLPALPRLAVQLLAMSIVVFALPEGTRVLPVLPLSVERVLLVIGGAWFVNLTNFMDGMDWMTVVEMVPVTLVLVLTWVSGRLPAAPGLLALGLLSGLVGYAPFNRPVARLFLGDVGSLPIGCLVAYGLYSLAGSGTGFGPLIAAILLPLYYLADSGITLVRRIARRERVWEPHRTHFYQIAVGRGGTVPAVLRRVTATNAALCILAGLSLKVSPWLQALSAALGVVVVTTTLLKLAAGRRAT